MLQEGSDDRVFTENLNWLSSSGQPSHVTDQVTPLMQKDDFDLGK